MASGAEKEGFVCMRLELMAWKSAHLFDSGCPDGKQFFHQHPATAPAARSPALFKAIDFDSAVDRSRRARVRFSSAASVLPWLRTLLFAVFPSSVLARSSRDSLTGAWTGPNDFLCFLLMGFFGVQPILDPKRRASDGGITLLEQSTPGAFLPANTDHSL